MDFVLGVVASLVATIICVVISPLFSRHARGLLISLLVRLLRVDMETVFINKQAASADIDAELLKATEIRMLTGRGNELQRGVFAQLAGGASRSRLKSLSILLPLVDFEATPHNPDWLSLREIELAAFDHVYSKDLLRNQVRSNIRYLEIPARDGGVNLRLFNFPHLGRIILTDSVAYLNIYRATAHGRDCEILKFRRGGPMYEYCQRSFDLLWSQALEPFPRKE